MNVVTAADLGRRAMAAIEEGLKSAEPLYVLRNSRPIAVVLPEVDYRRLLEQRKEGPPAMTAVQWLLSHGSRQTQTGPDIDTDVNNERNAWGKT